MKIVCIADTHGLHKEVRVPDGDVLVHAGDVTLDGSFKSFANFLSWFKSQPHKYKIFVAGNHDEVLEKNYNLVKGMLQDSGCIYLENNFYHLLTDGQALRIWGSPMTPQFMDWFFMEARDKIGKYWKNIPENLDVLITHGPPHDVLDYVFSTYGDHHVGCEELLKKVQEVKPTYHVFGHIHKGYGQEKTEGTTFVNASVCNEEYVVANKPVVLEI